MGQQSEGFKNPSFSTTSIKIPTLNHIQYFQPIRLNYQVFAANIGGVFEGKVIGACRRPVFLLVRPAMILKFNSDKKTHYDILGVNEDASFDEIRSTYRSALLNVHPDKQKDRLETSSLNNDHGNRFLEVQKAWEILGSPMSRVVYDRELQASRQDGVDAPDISLEDMSFEDVDDGFELLYDCRCGDYFSIGSSELEEMGYPLLKNGSEIRLQKPVSLPASVVIPCGSCSLKRIWPTSST
ncbi:hypothetical protein Leryth_003680 [Lithospermum erythrorhizon]|nr:hypothetical protein Leryth_003680 [Lithospermum erythrorhizon]